MFGTTETGWLERADEALSGEKLGVPSEKYLRDTFLASRDRVSLIATTVAAVGTFLVALLGIVVAISGSVSGEQTKATEAKEAAQLVRLDCAKDKDPAGSTCAKTKLQQAINKAQRAQQRSDEVARISDSQIVTVALMLLAFLAALASQMINPVVPPPSSTTLLADWRAIRDRYRQKRRLIEGAIFLDAAAVGVLFVVGLGLLQ